MKRTLKKCFIQNCLFKQFSIAIRKNTPTAIFSIPDSIPECSLIPLKSKLPAEASMLPFSFILSFFFLPLSELSKHKFLMIYLLILKCLNFSILKINKFSVLIFNYLVSLKGSNTIVEYKFLPLYRKSFDNLRPSATESRIEVFTQFSL